MPHDARQPPRVIARPPRRGPPRSCRAASRSTWRPIDPSSSMASHAAIDVHGGVVPRRHAGRCIDRRRNVGVRSQKSRVPAHRARANADSRERRDSAANPLRRRARTARASRTAARRARSRACRRNSPRRMPRARRDPLGGSDLERTRRDLRGALNRLAASDSPSVAPCERPAARPRGARPGAGSCRARPRFRRRI